MPCFKVNNLYVLQEGKLLSGVVNKLGDPSRKVASKAGYLLTSLLQEHPAMKVVVVAEVQRFMFRQGLQERARYYGVVFLNQMVLSHHASQGGLFCLLLAAVCLLPVTSSAYSTLLLPSACCLLEWCSCIRWF